MFSTSTELPTDALTHFSVDQTVCVISLKRIIYPPPLEVVVGCVCRVKWSDNKQYEATVLGMGEKSTHSWFWSLFTFSSLCVKVMHLQWLKKSVTGLQQEKDDEEGIGGHQEEELNDHHVVQASK